MQFRAIMMRIDPIDNPGNLSEEANFDMQWKLQFEVSVANTKILACEALKQYFWLLLNFTEK